MGASYELKCTTRPSSIAMVHDFIDRCLASLDPDGGWLADVHVIADEMASNIEKYAYETERGSYSVHIIANEGHLELDFKDTGKEFNPISVKELSITGDCDRPVGNLGILLVMNLADRISYARREGQNVTSVVIRVPTNPY